MATNKKSSPRSDRIYRLADFTQSTSCLEALAKRRRERSTAAKFYDEGATPHTEHVGALCFIPSDNRETKETIKGEREVVYVELVTATRGGATYATWAHMIEIAMARFVSSLLPVAHSYYLSIELWTFCRSTHWTEWGIR